MNLNFVTLDLVLILLLSPRPVRSRRYRKEFPSDSTQLQQQQQTCDNSDAFYFNVQPKGITVGESGRAFLECNVSNRCDVAFHVSDDVSWNYHLAVESG